MDKIAEYIKDLLFDHESLMVPDLGTFITSYQSAEVISGGSSTPPQHNISFSENPRNNDRVLTAHVMAQMHVSELEADAYVKDFADRIKHEVRYNKLYNFENVGVFSLTKDRRLTFDSSHATNFLGESFGMDSLKQIPPYTPPKVEEYVPQAEEYVAEIPIIKEEIPLVEHHVIDNIMEEPIVDEEVNSESEILTHHIEDPKTLEVEPIIESAPVLEYTEPTQDVVEEMVPEPEYIEEEPRKSWLRPILIGIAAGVALILGGLYFFDKSILGLDTRLDEKSLALQDTTLQLSLPKDTLGFSQITTDTTTNTLKVEPTTTVAVNTKPESKVATQDKIEPKKVEKVEPKPETPAISTETNITSDATISPDPSRYYVIAGGFSNETNANVFKKQLIKYGLSDIKFLTPQGDEKLIKVSVADFANADAAFSKAKELSESVKGIWVLTPKKK